MAKFNKLKEENYDYWNNQFDGHSSYMRSDSGNEYDILRGLLLHFVGTGESFLDVGCAMGDTLEASERRGKKLRYKGTDYAEKFTKANKKRRPDVEWETMDARSLKEKDNSYDTVCLYDVVDTLRDTWTIALDEAFRVARKRVIILMWMDADMPAKAAYMRSLGLKTLEIDIEGDGIHYHKMLIGEK
jgi:ubiquinone/menaquinone biosynthesis C-methylase UbiE